ncbi:hypothetical protein ENSA5_23380 [Enhygromyxa salina]|uniref:Uncharacterized protein n=1 Tax=Enhygromyxa salina TaxID=215803 RepID=A0A2S9YBM2_9BACT|nr:hypothetical protein [Enhygromyxa salina]PRQ02411.1 hypothetical protein ENSA5_23380 [Enhygromyxa salina]
MRYYASPGAALRVLSDQLPSWARGQDSLATVHAYLDAVPVDFSVFGFGLEYHLDSDRIDAGVALPLSRGRSELIEPNLLELRERLAGPDASLWPQRALDPARRVAALGPRDARMVQAFCLCMDGESLRRRRGPDLVYLSLRNLHRLRDPSQLIWSPAIARLVAALFGPRPAPGVELLERLADAARAWPSLRLAHLGVARVEAGGSLKPYLHGSIPELRALLTSPALPRAPGLDAPLELLADLARSGPAPACTVLLGSGPVLDRVDIEVSPGPGFGRALAFAVREHGVDDGRATELERLAGAGVQRVEEPGWAPVATRLSHLKLSLRAGDRPQWKAYFVARQAG